MCHPSIVWNDGDVVLVKLKIILTLLVSLLWTGLKATENVLPFGKSVVDLITIPEAAVIVASLLMSLMMVNICLTMSTMKVLTPGVHIIFAKLLLSLENF